MNETLKNLIERRSIKKYKNDKIDTSLLNQILEAGTYAANGRGIQGTSIVAIQNADLVRKLEVMNAEVMGSPNAKPFYNAPTVVVVFGDTSTNTFVEDGSLVIGNLMNAAYALGVDSCWIHRARQVFESEKGKKLKHEWGVEDKYAGIGFCILGYRDCDFPSPKPRKDDFVRIIL